MKEPLLSIIMPVFNTKSYLRNAFDNITEQISGDVEMIIIDDGSTDGSGKVCDEFAALIENVIVVHQENAGVSSARNVGIEVSHGRYLWFCDSDDRVLPGALSRLMLCLRTEEPQAVAFPVIQENDEGRELGLIPAPNGIGYGARGPLQSGDLLSPYAHVFRRDVIGSERFDTDLSLLEDRDFLYRVCQGIEGDISIIDEPLYAYSVTRKDSAVNSLPVNNYVIANDVQYRILENELIEGRVEPAYTIATRNTLGVLAIICKTGKCKDSFSRLRKRLLSFDKYAQDLTGLVVIKYNLCKCTPELYKFAYSALGRFHRRQLPGESVVVHSADS